MGHDDGALRRDQAMERWAAMRENIHLYWRPRFRNAVPLFFLLGVVPVGLYYGLVWGFVLYLFYDHIYFNSHNSPIMIVGSLGENQNGTLSGNVGPHSKC